MRIFYWPIWVFIVLPVLYQGNNPLIADEINILEDLKTKIPALICSPNHNISTESAFAAQIYSAHLSGRIFRSKTKISDSELKNSAIAHAKRLKHYGVSFGQCTDGSYWIVSTPAPVSAVISNNTIQIPYELMQNYCKDIFIDYGKWKGEISQSLDKKTQKLDITSFEPGIVAITCLPKFPRWLGPVAWYYIPVGHIKSFELPYAELIENNIQQNWQDVILLWINQIRRKENLPALLQGDKFLSEVAEILAEHGQIWHDRNLLKILAEQASSHRVKLIGENRVLGQSLKEMALLFWLSPRHRNLLLNKDALYLASSIKNTGEKKLMVLVLASSEQKKVTLNK